MSIQMLELPTPHIIPDPLHPAPSSVPAPASPPEDRSLPLVIDNGSTTLRAGFAGQADPLLACRNEGARYRDRKYNRNIVLYGEAVEADATSRAQARSPFEAGVVTFWDTMENGLDWTFLRLGLDSTPPILLSEAPCNPAYSRSLMSELLFEGYSTPAVSYGVDSLFSLYNAGHDDGLVISSGTSSTHVIPVLNGRGIFSAAKRLPWGGQQAADLMLKLVQLKYPGFPTKVTPAQATFLQQNHTTFSEDYQSDIRALSAPKEMIRLDEVIQFPFVPPVSDEKSAEELERIAEKKRESARRLQEQAAKQRLEKLVQKEQELNWLMQVKEFKAKEKKADYIKRLEAEGFESEKDFEDMITRTERSVQRARNKELGVDENEGKQEPPSFPLVDIPDHQLNEEDLKEKRKQRLLKAGYDARNRAKAEKERERLRQEAAAQKDLQERLSNPQAWLDKQRADYAALLVKLKEKERRRAQLSDRKSAAAQARMKNIADLAAEGRPGERSGKRKRKGDDDDGFGANDDDWAVYREIQGGADSDEEEDDEAALTNLEARLLEHDPTFTTSDTRDARMRQQHQLVTTFLQGATPIGEDGTLTMEQSYQLHLNVERIRVPEVMFQPSIAGLDNAGLAELVGHVLKNFNASERNCLTGNVFLTGGHTLTHNLSKRLHSSLLPLTPIGSPLVIRQAADPKMDAWRGMSKWASESRGQGEGWVTKAMYDEEGAERLEKRGAWRGRFGGW